MTRTQYPKVALAAALAALGFAAGSIAQTGTTQSGGKSTDGNTTGTKASAKDSAGGNLQGADRTFAMKAAQGGLAEVEAGKAAQQKAQNDAVKQFAQRMVTDHGKANEELMSLAKSKNVALPSALDKNHQAHMDKLNKLSGPQFDREYMKHMVDDHRKTVADFEKQSKSGKDEELKKWAGDKLPTLREHLKMAQSTHDQVAKGDKTASAGGASDAKTGGRSDQAKPVNTANPAGNTTGSNTGNIAGAQPKPQTTGK
jgi:putative membrane protein